MEEEKEGKEERENRQEENVKQLERQEKSLDDIKRVQEELNKLNKSLNSCIAIASASIMNAGQGKRFSNMKTVNHRDYPKFNQTLDTAQEENEIVHKQENYLNE